jgi:hypothetical protein
VGKNDIINKNFSIGVLLATIITYLNSSALANTTKKVELCAYIATDSIIHRFNHCNHTLQLRKNSTSTCLGNKSNSPIGLSDQNNNFLNFTQAIFLKSKRQPLITIAETIKKITTAINKAQTLDY